MKSHVATRVSLRASAPNVISVAGLPLSKQQRYRPKCCAKLAIAFFSIPTGNSLCRRIIPCFGSENSLIEKNGESPAGSSNRYAILRPSPTKRS
jgi:hypothetical protein